MGAQYINYGEFEGWASKIDKKNGELMEYLQEIKSLINELEGDWESDSAKEIRSKINGMEPRFQQYFGVVGNYAKFLRNTAIDYSGTENTNLSNAQQFI